MGISLTRADVLTVMLAVLSALFAGYTIPLVTYPSALSVIGPQKVPEWLTRVGSQVSLALAGSDENVLIVPGGRISALLDDAVRGPSPTSIAADTLPALESPDERPAVAATASSLRQTAESRSHVYVSSEPTARDSVPLRTLLDERFNDNRGGWPSNEQSTAWLADGNYRLFAHQPGQFVAIGAPVSGPLADVVVTAIFRKVGGPPGGGYGLIVRDQGPLPRDGINQSGRFYVLAVGDRGEMGIWRRDEDRWIDLLPWTPSDEVHRDHAANELSVRSVGPRLSLMVNGVEVASLVDSTLAEGAVGVFVGGDFNEVAVERLRVQVPD